MAIILFVILVEKLTFNDVNTYLMSRINNLVGDDTKKPVEIDGDHSQ